MAKKQSPDTATFNRCTLAHSACIEVVDLRCIATGTDSRDTKKSQYQRLHLAFCQLYSCLDKALTEKELALIANGNPVKAAKHFKDNPFYPEVVAAFRNIFPA